MVEVTDGTYPRLEIEIRSERCNHCQNAPCVRCCPTGASHYAAGGTVLVIPEKCIGCGACIASCPNDARYPHPDGYPDKCTFCLPNRVEQGLQPACVSVCPTKCMYFGDLDDPNNEVLQVRRNRKWKTLIPEAGTQPHLYFLI
ncbi:MAG: 4Fe-4S binding protein [Bacteroidales bacterium]|nr:4Fe-4S binding protein [Bacteroidales bacterium]